MTHTSSFDEAKDKLKEVIARVVTAETDSEDGLVLPEAPTADEDPESPPRREARG